MTTRTAIGKDGQTKEQYVADGWKSYAAAIGVDTKEVKKVSSRVMMEMYVGRRYGLMHKLPAAQGEALRKWVEGFKPPDDRADNTNVSNRSLVRFFGC